MGLFKKSRAEYMMDVAKKHMDEEGVNLKNILVKKNCISENSY